ncbi:MAG: hydroxyethylthiazole kinase [Bacteroidales bacterium]|nr:hydroxyethylthiazole kinase [Candidatus Colicola caccequi]
MIDSLFHLSLHQLRQTAPVVHCITNHVAMDLTANALLAVGARPLMAAAPAEMEELAQVANALLINIGTLDDTLIQASLIAGRAMHQLGKPIVLDPVGVQVSNYRLQAALTIINECHPTIVKGNQREMEVLLPKIARPEFIAVTTGEQDTIIAANRQEQLMGGSTMMTQVTAMGCTAGAMIAAMASVEPDPFLASCYAIRLMKDAGANAQTEVGLGTYRQRFIDYLSHV